MKIPPLFHTRPLFSAALGMLFGVLVASALGAAGLLAIVSLVVMLLFALWNRRAVTIFCGFFALAALLLVVRTPLPASEGTHHIDGRVAETPEQNENGTWVLILDSLAIDGQEQRGRFRLTTPAKADYGDILSGETHIRAPQPQYVRSNAYRRLIGTGFAPDIAVVGRRATAYGAVLALRTAAATRVNALFPGNGGVAAGMLLGDKSGIDETRYQDYHLSGAAHLLAVSGLHVSVLAGAWMLLFRRNPWLKFFMTALFLLGYCVLTAFSPSVVRASVMTLCFLLSRPFKLPVDRLSNLSLAFILILLVNPFALFDPGFQLSFLAIYGLITLAPLIADALRPIGRRPASLLGAGLAVWLAALPQQTVFFESVPLFSCLGNLFLLPLAPFFLIPAFLVFLLSFVSFPLADALSAFPRLILDVIDFIARLSGPSLTLPVPDAAATLLYLAALLFFSRLCMRSKTRRALYGGLLLAGSAAAWFL